MSSNHYQDPVYRAEEKYEKLVCRDARGQAAEGESKGLHEDLGRWRACLERVRDSIDLQLDSRKAYDELREAEYNARSPRAKMEDGDQPWGEDEEHIEYLRWRSRSLSFKRSVVERLEYVRHMILRGTN